MKRFGIPLLILVLYLSGCSRPVSIGGLYLLDRYDGSNPVLKELVGSLGVYVEPYTSEDQGPGFAFIPVLVSEGQLQPIPDQSVADPPWRLLATDKNRYAIPLALDKQYAWDARAKEESLEGRLQGLEEKSFFRFTKVETGE